MLQAHFPWSDLKMILDLLDMNSSLVSVVFLYFCFLSFRCKKEISALLQQTCQCSLSCLVSLLREAEVPRWKRFRADFQNQDVL